MNNKKFLLIPIILMLLMIIISSASAGELNTAEDLTINEDVSIDNGDSINLDEEPVDNDIFTENEEFEQLDITKDKETLSDSNSITVTDKTFSGIQAAIDNANENDTIILDGEYDISPELDGSFYPALQVNKRLNFVGINNATLSYHYTNGWWDSTVNGWVQSYGGSIFRVDASNVTFKGITFINGASQMYNYTDTVYGRGGAIISSKYIEVFDCNFFNNTSECYGGAIYASSAYIKNCNFTDNSANSEKAGALYISNDGNVINCYFNNCYSSKFGGAISGLTSTAVNYYLNITNSTFINCRSKYGGAIFKTSYKNINYSSFINCSATFGGAIYDDWNVLTINNSYFENNVADNGGAISGLSNIYLYNSNFTANHASQRGGAIMICPMENIITDCLFNDNYAKSGGSISFNPMCTTADPYGSGMHFSNDFTYLHYCDDPINLNNCNFTNSYANGGSGGSILFYNVSSGNISSCNFKNSCANSSNGGALSFENASAINLTNCSFANSHSFNGGAISIDELCSGFNISYSKFTDNVAEECGGAIYFLGEKGTVFSSTFKNNSCPFDGGAIYIAENSKYMGIYYSNFTANSVITGYMGDNKFGGAICWLAEQGVIIYSNFYNNSCPDDGGAIFINNGTSSINLTGCEFKGNSILNNYAMNRGGGALCSISKSIVIRICSFISNMALNSYGGAIYLNSGMNSLNGKNLLGSNALSDDEYSSSITETVFKDNDAFKAKALYAVSETQFAFNPITLNPDETLEDLFYGISADQILESNTLERIKAKSAISASNVTSYYGKTFSVKVVSKNATGVKYSIKNSAGTVVKSGTVASGASITGLKFAPGTYKIYLTTTVDENHTSSSYTSTIKVNKATATITAKALTTYYASGKTWSITLKDTTNNKLLASKKVTLKVYTGTKYKTYTVTTNSKGVATFKASTIAPGTHKVILSYSNSNYNCKSLTSSLKINKMALSYKVSRSTQKDGAGLHIWVKNKATGKVINKIKVKLLVYTGKKYKTISLVSGKYSNKGNGYAGYAVKGPVYSVGTHTVKVMAGDSYHSGSIQSTLVLKSTVKKYGKKVIIISKGSRSVKSA